MKGKVQTVQGSVEPRVLGAILPHEHLGHEINPGLSSGPLPTNFPQVQDESVSLENFGLIQRYPGSFPDNLKYSDDAVHSALKHEMRFYKKVGGGTVVDNGCYGIRDKNHTIFLKELSKETGVHIVAATGFYVEPSVSSGFLKMSQEELEEVMRNEILTGIEGTDVKAGIIGEIGTMWPIKDFEKKSLKASAIVQQETGCPVIIHPGKDPKAPEEVIRIFQEAGGTIRHTVMSHLDRTLVSKEELIEFASLGSYCEFDLFGFEISHFQTFDTFDMPNDAQRIKRLKYLIEEGFLNRIVISHDIYTKHRLMKFGGHGYSHILLNVVPKMLKRGFTENEVKKIIYDNPREWLTFQ